jgi:hypothetical protein
LSDFVRDSALHNKSCNDFFCGHYLAFRCFPQPSDRVLDQQNSLKQMNAFSGHQQRVLCGAGVCIPANRS